MNNLDESMLVSIITVAFNAEKTISRTIESVLNQTYSTIEYIIIDGASNDNTLRIANSYKDRFKGGKTITIISEKDKGMYDALNKGANLSHGVIIGQINADDWYEEDAVSQMVKLWNDTGYDVAWGNIRIIRNNKNNLIKKASNKRIWTTRGWCHPAMFSQRKVLIDNPYPLESIYDDFDFITNIKKQNLNIKTLDVVISNFSIGGISTQKSFKAVINRINISYNIYKKYGMKKLYFWDRVLVEFSKYLIG